MNHQHRLIHINYDEEIHFLHSIPQQARTSKFTITYFRFVREQIRKEKQKIVDREKLHIFRPRKLRVYNYPRKS